MHGRLLKTSPHPLGALDILEPLTKLDRKVLKHCPANSVIEKVTKTI